MIALLIIIGLSVIVALNLHDSYSIIATIALVLFCCSLILRVFFIINVQKSLHVFVKSKGVVRTGALQNPVLQNVFGQRGGVQKPIQWLIIWVLETTLILSIVTYDIAVDMALYNPFDTVPSLSEVIMFYVDVVLKGILADFMEVYGLYLPGSARFDAIGNPIFGFFIFSLRFFVAATVLSIIIILLRGDDEETSSHPPPRNTDGDLSQQEAPLRITKQ